MTVPSSFPSKATRSISSNNFATPFSSALSNCRRADGRAPDVDPEELARGELREETGLVASSMIYLGAMWIAYGFTRQKQHVFLASGLTHAETDPDPEEHDLILHTVSIAEFERMLLDGTIQDACTLGAWGLYKVWKEKQAR